MFGWRPTETPMVLNHKLGAENRSEEVDKESYQWLVGKLIYLSHTRPDIAFALSVISQFMQAPKRKHLEVVYTVLRYLKSVPGRGLLFKKCNTRGIEVYTYAN